MVFLILLLLFQNGEQVRIWISLAFKTRPFGTLFMNLTAITERPWKQPVLLMEIDNILEGSMCSFAGVECWHPDENKVLNLRSPIWDFKVNFLQDLRIAQAWLGWISQETTFLDWFLRIFQKGYLMSHRLTFHSTISQVKFHWISLVALIPIPLSHAPVKASNFLNNRHFYGAPSNYCTVNSKKGNTGVIIGSATGGIIMIIVVVGFVLYFCMRKMPYKKKETDVEENK